MAIAAFNEYQTKEQAATSLANDVADRLRRVLDQEGRAGLAVSGGQTPKLFFELLSKQALDWERTLITVVDERDVPPDHARSNQKMVRETLMVNNAAAARFLALDDPDALSELPDPLAVTVLGMGADGHTASWFPGGDNLAAAVDQKSENIVVPMNAPGAGEPRLTMTLPIIAESKFIALHLEGQHKRNVLADATEKGDPDKLPIRHILRQANIYMHIYWAP